MTDQEASEEFRHYHGDALKTLKLNRIEGSGELRKDLTAIPSTENPDARKALVEHWEKLQDEIGNDLAPEAVDAETVFKRALRNLERVQEFRFLIDNLLEAVKCNRSLSNDLQTYRDLGLFPKGAARPPEETQNSPWPWNWGVGAFLKKIMKGLKKLAMVLIQVLVNALKAIPRFAEIELRPNLGMVGPFPTATFEFNLKAKGITVHELFEALFASVEV